MKLIIRARCGVQSGPSPRAELCSVWPKWNFDIFSQHAASRTRFLQVNAVQTGHISKKYRQTGDVLSVFSKGTAAAQSRMKISRYLCKYCSNWLRNFTVTLFQLFAKDDFNASLQWCRGFPQNHRCKNRPFQFARLCEIKSSFFPMFSRLLLYHYSSSARSES